MFTLNQIINKNNAKSLLTNACNAQNDVLRRFALTVKAKQDKKNERRSLVGDAAERHLSLDVDALRCKAINLVLNALAKGKLSFAVTRPQIESTIKGYTLKQLDACRSASGFNMDKLFISVKSSINKERKEAKKAKAAAKKSAKAKK